MIYNSDQFVWIYTFTDYSEKIFLRKFGEECFNTTFTV